MKKIVVYDSQFGNTEKIARVIGKSISAKIIKVKDLNVSDLDNIDLLVIGSPTQGGRATSSIQKFLNDVASNTLKSKKVAVFDTRFREKDLNFALKLLVKIIGYASPKMAKTLKNKGAKLVVPSEGFIVKDKEGPLAFGELERAEKWLE